MFLIAKYLIRIAANFLQEASTDFEFFTFQQISTYVIFISLGILVLLGGERYITKEEGEA